MTELEQLRTEIDRIDTQIAKNVKMRLDIVKLIGRIKKQNGTAITDSDREKIVIKNFTDIAGKNTESIIKTIIEVSKKEE
ncbi:MAG: chorismate mutase [Phascolarctobacterium sp.]|nr:chorismate mutase [Candidatus Phascolarctobacterium caballi]